MVVVCALFAWHRGFFNLVGIVRIIGHVYFVLGMYTYIHLNRKRCSYSTSCRSFLSLSLSVVEIIRFSYKFMTLLFRKTVLWSTGQIDTRKHSIGLWRVRVRVCAVCTWNWNQSVARIKPTPVQSINGIFLSIAIGNASYSWKTNLNRYIDVSFRALNMRAPEKMQNNARNLSLSLATSPLRHNQSVSGYRFQRIESFNLK